jgi:signal transduction histidine kinase/ActR/RegA family two-component response regulator
MNKKTFKTKLKKLSSELISSIIRHFAIITKMVFLLTIISCYFFIKSSTNHLESEQINHIKSTSSNAYRNIYSNISYAKYQLHYVAKQLAKTGGNQNKVDKILSSYKTNINDDFDLVTTWNMYSWINNKDMLTVDGFEGKLNKPINMSHRDYLQITKKYPTKLVYGSTVKGAISGRHIIPIAIGVIDDYSFRYSGTIVFGVDIEKLSARVEVALIDDLAKFLIIDDNQNIIFKSSHMNNREARKIIASSDLEDIGADGQQNAGNLFLKIRPMSNIGGAKKNLYLIVSNNEEIFADKKKNLIIKNLLAFLTVALVLFLFMARIYYKIVRPVKVLSDYASNIAKHKHRTIISEDFLGSKEFQQLYKTLRSIERHIETEHSLKDQLATSNKRLQSLVKSINHDLRNYIAGIAGLADILEENLKNKNQCAEENANLIQMIKSQSQDILSFATSLLNNDKIEEEAAKINQNQNFDAKELIENIIFLAQKFIKEQGVEIAIEADTKIPSVLTNKVKFRQILDNLITNAIKYSPKGSKVTITIKQQQKHLHIKIADNGIGMSKEETDMALGGHGREIAKNNLNKTIDSHGIGLPIVKQAIDEIGAKMHIESTKGQGTNIELWFDAAQNADDEKSPNFSNEEKIIIIADDEKVNLLILKRLIQKSDKEGRIHIISAHNGQEVIDILQTAPQKIDLMFLDNNMPKLNGTDTAKKIRKMHSFANVPLIAVSGDNDVDSIKTALEAGFNDYISKPFTAEALEKVLIDNLFLNFRNR